MNEAREQALAAEEARLRRQERRAQRQPMTWPMAAVLVTLFGVLGFSAWLCAGVARDWIAQ